MASPSFRSLTSHTVSGNSVACTAPSGLADDDILIFAVERATVTDTSEAVSWPTGFTELFAVDHDGGSFQAAWKRASSESGSYTASWTTSTNSAALLWAVSGVDTGDTPNVASATAATGSDANPNPGSVSFDSSGDHLVIAVYGQEGKGQTFTAPTNYTEPSGSDVATGGAGGPADHCAISMSYRAVSGPGPEDPGTATSTTSDGWAANTIAMIGVSARTINAAVTLSNIDTAAQVDTEIGVAAAVTLKAVTLAAQVDTELDVAAAQTLPAIATQAQVDTEIGVAVAQTLPAISTSASVIHDPAVINASQTLPMVTLAAQVDTEIGVAGALTLPMVTLAAVVDTEIGVAGALTLPAVATSASLSVSAAPAMPLVIMDYTARLSIPRPIFER